MDFRGQLAQMEISCCILYAKFKSNWKFTSGAALLGLGAPACGLAGAENRVLQG